ncbi:MAG: uracil-DNA glycosylase [Pseudomonadota bacterium]|nr:uracil-DNA glycosylase [Pseudomonadota bacterium]
MPHSPKPSDPGRDCPNCPRLVAYRCDNRAMAPDWHNAPVDTWVSEAGDGDVRLLVVGLAPGVKGANRTGRPFTGDYAGDLLYATLARFGLASGAYDARPDDTLALQRCAITNAVRCVPPQNKPTGSEINQCRPYLQRTIARFGNLAAIVTLGRIAHDSTLRALGERVASAPFGHDSAHHVGAYRIFSSYHCSRYNTNTGRLTPAMFEAVFARAAEHIGETGGGASHG